MPAVNDIKRPGQNDPPNPLTDDSVACMNIIVIGKPIMISAHRHSLAHNHNKGPFNCIHTSIWPNMKSKNAIAICL